MNFSWKEIFRGAILGFLLPAVLLWAAVTLNGRSEAQLPKPPLSSGEGVGRETLPSATIPAEQARLWIQVLQDGQIQSMDLEEYLLGVMLAEVPMDFEQEALKAQAVVARTYTLKSYGGTKHPQGAVCTDYNCCQAYISPEMYLQIGGTEQGIETARTVLQDTFGQVLTYEGDLIVATYFSCSGGSTEDAQAVWGQDIPYLQAVESPGEENAAVYSDTFTFTAEQFQSALGIRLEGRPEQWFGEVTYTEGEGVNTMQIGAVHYRGTTLRTLLGLRSTKFQVSVSDDVITITTMGFGHRVGMSQYGAEAMAVAGSDYQAILAHYYQGAILDTYDTML